MSGSAWIRVLPTRLGGPGGETHTGSHVGPGAPCRSTSWPPPPSSISALTEHDEAMARARAAVTRINAVLAAAHDRGDLKFFNAEFRRRRMAAERPACPS